MRYALRNQEKIDAAFGAGTAARMMRDLDAKIHFAEDCAIEEELNRTTVSGRRCIEAGGRIYTEITRYYDVIQLAYLGNGTVVEQK
jgi:hypothetical protein